MKLQRQKELDLEEVREDTTTHIRQNQTCVVKNNTLYWSQQTH